MKYAGPFVLLTFIALAMVLGAVGVSGVLWAEGLSDLSAQIPAQVIVPNRFGLAGDDAWLEAGQQTVSVNQRKRVVEITAPGTLDQADTEYRLMNDVESDGTAFKIVKNHITLNLNNHTVTYARKPTGKTAYGVAFFEQWTFKDVAVVNGAIMQAEPYVAGALGEAWGIPYGSGSSPVFGMSLDGAEFAGLHLVYGGKDLSGIYAKGRLHIHHNTIEDKGHGVTNRHRGLAAIEGASDEMRAHHNLIIRARHNGIRAGKNSEVFRNVVHIDSEATNSAGISAGGNVYENKIVGRGVHPLGFYLGGNVVSNGARYVGNHVEVQNTRQSEEYGSAGAACLRLQWGVNIHVAENVFILHAGESLDGFKSWGRALMVSLSEAGRKALFENNLILAMGRDGKGKAAGVGIVANNQSSDLVFRNNTVVSTWSAVLLADTYGHADGFACFEDNVFMKAVRAPEFKTIRSQYSDIPSTGVFWGTKFVGGASYDDVDLEFQGAGLKEIGVGWHVTVKVVTSEGDVPDDVVVSVKDVHGVVAYSGNSGENGAVTVNLEQYRLSNRNKSLAERKANSRQDLNAWRVPSTPHTISVTSGSRSVTRQVHVDRDMDVVFNLP